MDLNYFLYREQVSLMRADSAACAQSRHAHLGLAGGYRRVIRSVYPSGSVGSGAVQ